MQYTLISLDEEDRKPAADFAAGFLLCFPAFPYITLHKFIPATTYSGIIRRRPAKLLPFIEYDKQDTSGI